MPKSRSRSVRSDDNRPQPHPTSRWPTGTSYEDVFDYERALREEEEAKLADRIRQIEDRLLIVNDVEKFEEQYPDLKEAYDKFREEEAKMMTFEALKKDDGNSK